MSSTKSLRSIKRAFWNKHLENWQASGLTQQRYCQQENINLTTFTWWRSKSLKDKSPEKPIAFVPAVIKEAVHFQSSDAIQIVLPNQIKVMLPPNLSVCILTALVRSLGGLS